MRQTGRTSRIVNFAVDQLYSVGEVIVTDHTAFECPDKCGDSLKYFADTVERRFTLSGNGTKRVDFKIIKLVRGSNIKVIHFFLVNNIKS
tara:strand:- start:104 stop:373 length:270 start_codon:yes stop_codon:yes gene_type:complete